MAALSAAEPKSFLKSVLSYSNDQANSPHDRPFVTLTYAQSLDGKIAGKDGKQLILSGDESMTMTHWMRTMHDGILVGIGTALNDDPQLNTRRLPPQTAPYPQPTPIILDSQLRFQTSCKLIRNYASGTGCQPWVVCSSKSALSEKAGELRQAGVRVIPVAIDAETGKLDLDDVLSTLKTLEIGTLMVEGGQKVISSLLSYKSKATDRSVVDTIIITVAPIYVGTDGVGALNDGQAPVNLVHVSSATLGKDSIVVCRIAEP
ncbi:2,5-diamino-6-(ribosylamino)-4(3H)-pyrimidinone 5'-phosphate reductase [Tulasnella sp. 427]|nr:2,5-diamino-6-(ribosylamino)-4(3H)-pyrimidinone 5'-phosphate reductase [Tulasnella sp. 427]